MRQRIVRQRPWWLTAAESEGPFGSVERDIPGWPRGWSYPLRPKNWMPTVDIVDKGDRLVLRAELPGVPLEAIDITLEKGVLTVKGERRVEEAATDDKWLCCERQSGTFSRAIQLPGEIDAEKVTAEYKDGVLTVTLPKLAKSQPQKVTVKVG